VSRIIILAKSAECEVRRLLQPRSVNKVRLGGRVVSDSTVRSTLVYLLLCIFILAASTLIIALDGLDFTTNITASVACLFNIGPGLSVVGPMGSFAVFSAPAKLVLSFCMLLGRLEIYPVIMVLARVNRL
ncbi:MAG: TrkH family potassium uptake protein, partial [Oscillospiraceae bacterium]|nr:TrkH family potassium uptake protein [Oscillospiraceae bacterium]